VAPGARLRLGFNAVGVLAEVRAKMGDVVKKGQLLARLRDGGASAALQMAEAQRGKAQRDQKRAATLVAAEAIASAQSDDALSALRVANANSSMASAAVGERVLYAPIAGTVLERLAEPGETMAPGVPVLVLDTQRLVVKVGVTESELPRVAPNQAATLVVDGKDDAGAAAVSGTVTSVAPAPREDGLYSVEVQPALPADGQKDVLRAGMTLLVNFVEIRKRTAIHVPLEALVDRGGKTWAFVVLPASSGGDGGRSLATLKIRELEVDPADDKDVVVRRGLEEGDRVVREGAYFLEADETVRLMD